MSEEGVIMRVTINKFTGPLDLLLHLIRKEEMDIFDIDIHKITEQYLDFMHKNPVPNLDSAGEFVRMAALLIYIKSKSMFPSPVEGEETPTEEELKAILTKNLLKMQLVQSLSKQLNQYAFLKRDIWSGKGEKGLFTETEQNKKTKPQSVLNLMRAYHRVFQKAPSARFSNLSEEVDPPVFLMDEIHSLHKKLATVGSSLKMSSLIKQKDKDCFSQTLIVFLVLLELTRLGMVSPTQEENFSDIDILVKKQFNKTDFQSVQSMEI